MFKINSIPRRLCC